MRQKVSPELLEDVMRAIASRSTGPGSIYLVGGASALLLGIRNQTIDIDLKLDPEPAGVFEAIAHMKNEFDVNIELASPDDFFPALPGWKVRSEFIASHGKVTFYHYDFYGQALSKILRGHAKDLEDARSLVRLGKVLPDRLVQHFREIQSGLIRYPSISAETFEANVLKFARGNKV